MSLTLTIGGSNFLPQYKTNSAKIKEILQNRSNTANLVITKKSSQSVPQEGQEIIFKDGSRFLFAGFISRISPVEVGEGELFIYRIEATDYTYVLLNKNAQKSYENRTLKYIVEDLISTYVDSGYSITTTNVDTGPTIDTIAFDHINLKKCFEKLAKLTGYEWYIDFEKDIYFRNKETAPAPEEITDTSDNFINISIKYDTAQVRNYVIIQGGTEETASYFSQKFLGDGKAREFILREKPRDMEFIKLNTVSKNVGVDPLDEETGNYFMFNFQEKYIRVIDSEPVPGAADEIEASYKYDVPVIVLLKSASSIETMKDLEGGDGIHSFSIVDSSIKSKDEARQRALKELLEFANPLVNAIFTTRTGLLTAGSYFKPGQELTINLPSWNINTDTKYLIQEVETTLVEDGTNIEYNYKVRFGGRLLDVIALLDGIAGKEDILKDTQEIDRIEAIAEELSIAEVITRDGNLRSISESLSIAEVIDETIVTPPFKWSPSAVNPDLAAKWNKFEWGG